MESQVLDHDDALGEGILSSGFDVTKRLYEARFDALYNPPLTQKVPPGDRHPAELVIGPRLLSLFNAPSPDTLALLKEAATVRAACEKLWKARKPEGFIKRRPESDPHVTAAKQTVEVCVTQAKRWEFAHVCLQSCWRRSSYAAPVAPTAIEQQHMSLRHVCTTVPAVLSLNGQCPIVCVINTGRRRKWNEESKHARAPCHTTLCHVTAATRCSCFNCCNGGWTSEAAVCMARSWGSGTCRRWQQSESMRAVCMPQLCRLHLTCQCFDSYLPTIRLS